jgi:glutamine cyclotransferase
MQKKFIFSFIILIVSTIIYFYQKSIKENYPLNSPDFKILKIYNRKNDSKTYTQGLMFSDDKKTIYESAGLYKESGIKQFEYPSLKLIKNQKINSNYFGEGIAKCGNFIYQLTWREKKIIKYNKNLEIIEEFEMDNKINEGWGLSDSNNKNELFATDGSDKIYRLDCNNNLKVISSIKVKEKNGKSIYKLNDLTYSNGFIYVNIYTDTRIIKVDLNGLVVNKYNLNELVNYELKKGILTKSRFNYGDVLNGIAYNSKKDNFLVTGKRWGYMYEITFNN